MNTAVNDAPIEADCFIDCDSDPEKQVNDLLNLFFRTTEARRPTHAEYGMFVATVTSTQSPELGRRVGAAILREGSILAVGTNSHPTQPSKKPTHDASKGDIAKLVLDTLARLSEGGRLDETVARQLREQPEELVEELLGNELDGSQLADLTEFQRPVHAEMAAILNALEQAQSIKDATIYVTTFPCHGCAKHLLRLELMGIYLEPYPKGRAEAMYGPEVKDSMRPFTGIAPRLYMRVFDSSARRDDLDGPPTNWDPEDRTQARPSVSSFIHDSTISSRADYLIARLTKEMQPSTESAEVSEAGDVLPDKIIK